MAWWDEIAEGIGDIEQTGEGFSAKVSLPVGEDGFFGRQCSACRRVFKMLADEWDPIAERVDHIWCPYCGHQHSDASNLLTTQQLERATAAAEEVARAYAENALNEMFGRLARSTRGSRHVKITHTPVKFRSGQSLPTYLEENARRSIVCDDCGTHFAVYGAAAFCPACGPRAALDTILESIEAGRQSLALEDALPSELREQAEASGVFDSFATDSIENTVTLFETFARAEFEKRVPGHEQILQKETRNVFQRLDGADRLFRDHAGFGLRQLVSLETWALLETAFQQRHVISHRHGIVDQSYLDRVPASTLAVGQRLVVDRREAEAAYDALEALVRAMSSR
jgi:uncharacterized Zn finger protein (UPF0148 family)